MDSIHAKCAALRELPDKVTLVCGKSRGHLSPQCYDPDRDIFFMPEYRRKPTKGRKS